jgi:uncharacterized protein (TIGR03435 family)
MSDRIARKLDFTRNLLLDVAGWLIVAMIALFGLVDVAQSQAQSPTDKAAQGIAGTWQGILHAGKDLRTVVKITKADDGGYKAVFYSIDQAGGDGLNVNKTTLEGTTLKMSITLIGGNYEGKVSPDGNTITGNWSQGPNPLPLVLTRATPETEWTMPPPAPKLPPMAADANPSFEVATIKPNDSGKPSMLALTIQGRNFKTINSSLADLIQFSYGVQIKQVLNGPDWMSKDRYDISAVPEEEGVPNPEQLRIMIRKLLADRFKLTFHHDKRELSAYVLTVVKSGSKLTPTERPGPLPGLGFQPGTGGVTIRAINATMPDLTGLLQVLVLDRPVVDQTGLTGRYDLHCTFTPDDSQFNGHPPFPPPQQQTDAAAPAAPSAPSLYDAFQQELGLKLSAEKTPVDVLVIDHAEKPSEN